MTGSVSSPGAAARSLPDASVAILLPRHIRRRVLSAEVEARLREVAEVREPVGETLDAADLPGLVEGASAVLTGWGTPPLAGVLGPDRSIGLVAHTAGTIRQLVPEASLREGVKVSHAAGIIASAVAELVVGEVISELRQVRHHDAALRRGDDWRALLDRFPGRLLGRQTVGVIGAGYVGRKVISHLRAFGCEVLVADPYLTAEQAADLGVQRAELNDLFGRCLVVTLHAPVLPSTMRMVTAAHLAALPDGALFVNMARAVLVDDDALLAELQSGRIRAVLDVFEQEPVPADSPYLRLDNVVVSPHIAGRTEDTHLIQGQEMVEEIARYLAGQGLRYEVTPAMWETMA